MNLCYPEDESSLAMSLSLWKVLNRSLSYKIQNWSRLFHFIFYYGRSSRLISVTWNIISTVTEGALSICEHHCCAFVLATFLNGAGVVQLLTSHYKTVSYLRTQFVRCDLKLQRCTALATHKRRHQRYWPRFLQRILPSQVWSAAGTDTFASRRTRVRLAFGIP